MKRIGLAIIAVAFSISCGFAQQQTVSVKEKAPAKQQLKTVVGKVESVTAGDLTKATKPGIVIMNEKGAAEAFNVAAGAVIQDAGQKVITLDKIVKEEKVQLKYCDGTNGSKEVSSITVM